MTKKKKRNRKAKEKQSEAEKEETVSHIEDNKTEDTDALTGGAEAATGSGALTGQKDNLSYLTGGAEVESEADKETVQESETGGES